MYAYKVTQYDVLWCKVKAEKYYLDPYEATKAFEEWANPESSGFDDDVVDALKGGSGWMRQGTTYSYYISRIEII